MRTMKGRTAVSDDASAHGGESTEAAIRRARTTGDRRIRDHVVADHRWLALTVARQLKREGEELEDLAQVAMIGILKAVDRFDPDYGVSFRTYASATAKGEVRRHYRDAGWSVSVPRRLKDLRYEVSAATDMLRERLRRSPTSAEVADYLGIARDEVEDCITAGSNFRALPLDRPNGEPRTGGGLEDDTWEDRLVGELVARTDLVELMTTLPERLQRVLVLRFVEERKQSDIATIIGVSQVHVSRLLQRAVRDLRELAARRSTTP